MNITVKHAADNGTLTEISVVHHTEFPFMYIIYECNRCEEVVLSLEDEDYYFA